jgi:hypothetical protein
VKDLKWPAVVVIVVLIAVLGWLSDRGKDATTVLAGVIAILSALGFGYINNKQSEIAASSARLEENTNGRMTQLTNLVEQQRLQIASINDQHRRDMLALADKLAIMTPPLDLPVTVSGVPSHTHGEHNHTPDL